MKASACIFGMDKERGAVCCGGGMHPLSILCRRPSGPAACVIKTRRLPARSLAESLSEANSRELCKTRYQAQEAISQGAWVWEIFDFT